jgi:hypothetical protein
VPTLVRYFSEENARKFLDQGEVLFRALSYFRDYEDDGVRSDEFEGTLVHLPKEGLRATMVASGQEVDLPYSLESTAREDDIFVYCMSTEVNKDIGQRFKADVAIEITKPQVFLSRVRSALALRRRIRADRLMHQEVRYYERHEPPIVDWALPERIAMRKPASFSWQKEYRLAVPLGNAFAVENVQVKLVSPGAPRQPRAQVHPKLLLKLGPLGGVCLVHKL